MEGGIEWKAQAGVYIFLLCPLDNGKLKAPHPHFIKLLYAYSLKEFRELWCDVNKNRSNIFKISDKIQAYAYKATKVLLLIKQMGGLQWKPGLKLIALNVCICKE